MSASALKGQAALKQPIQHYGRHTHIASEPNTSTSSHKNNMLGHKFNATNIEHSLNFYSLYGLGQMWNRLVACAAGARATFVADSCSPVAVVIAKRGPVVSDSSVCCVCGSGMMSLMSILWHRIVYTAFVCASNRWRRRAERLRGTENVAHWNLLYLISVKRQSFHPTNASRGHDFPLAENNMRRQLHRSDQRRQRHDCDGYDNDMAIEDEKKCVWAVSVCVPGVGSSAKCHHVVRQRRQQAQYGIKRNAK